MIDGGLVAARALAYGALLLAAGLPLYLLSAAREVVVTRPWRAGLSVLLATGAAASVWLALASVAAMAALPIGALDGATVTAVLSATPLGAVLEIRLAAIALALLVIALRLPVRLVALPAGVALATAAWTGHAGASEGAIGAVHRLADVVHLLAAATWLGALLMLLGAVFGPTRPRDLERRLAGFAVTGTALVALLLLTGVVNALVIAGPSFKLTSAWTFALALKLALFGGMLCLAALNRWRLTPALAAGTSGARRALRRSLACEMALGLGVVALVAVLGVLDPAT
jgi:putative copper resistance protein D